MAALRVAHFLLVFIVATSAAQTWPQKNKILHIGGIFPINGTEGWQGGLVKKELCLTLNEIFICVDLNIKRLASHLL